MIAWLIKLFIRRKIEQSKDQCEKSADGIKKIANDVTGEAKRIKERADHDIERHAKDYQKGDRTDDLGSGSAHQSTEPLCNRPPEFSNNMSNKVKPTRWTGLDLLRLQHYVDNPDDDLDQSAARKVHENKESEPFGNNKSKGLHLWLEARNEETETSSSVEVGVKRAKLLGGVIAFLYGLILAFCGETRAVKERTLADGTSYQYFDLQVYLDFTVLLPAIILIALFVLRIITNLRNQKSLIYRIIEEVFGLFGSLSTPINSLPKFFKKYRRTLEPRILCHLQLVFIIFGVTEIAATILIFKHGDDNVAWESGFLDELNPYIHYGKLGIPVWEVNKDQIESLRIINNTENPSKTFSKIDNLFCSILFSLFLWFVFFRVLFSFIERQIYLSSLGSLNFDDDRENKIWKWIKSGPEQPETPYPKSLFVDVGCTEIKFACPEKDTELVGLTNESIEKRKTEEFRTDEARFRKLFKKDDSESLLYELGESNPIEILVCLPGEISPDGKEFLREDDAVKGIPRKCAEMIRHESECSEVKLMNDAEAWGLGYRNYLIKEEKTIDLPAVLFTFGTGVGVCLLQEDSSRVEGYELNNHPDEFRETAEAGNWDRVYQEQIHDIIGQDFFTWAKEHHPEWDDEERNTRFTQRVIAFIKDLEQSDAFLEKLSGNKISTLVLGGGNARFIDAHEIKKEIKKRVKTLTPKSPDLLVDAGEHDKNLHPGFLPLLAFTSPPEGIYGTAPSSVDEVIPTVPKTTLFIIDPNDIGKNTDLEANLKKTYQGQESSELKFLDLEDWSEEEFAKAYDFCSSPSETSVYVVLDACITSPNMERIERLKELKNRMAGLTLVLIRKPKDTEYLKYWKKKARKLEVEWEETIE